jgi:hypothetical protein
MEGDGIRERDLPQDGEPTCWYNVEVFPIFNSSDSGATSAPLAASPASNVCPCGYNSFDIDHNGVRLHLNDRCQEGGEKSEASGQDLRTLLVEALTITQWTLPNSRVGSCRRSGTGNCAMPRGALCRMKITSETRIRRMMT